MPSMQRLDAHWNSPAHGAPAFPSPRGPGTQHGTGASEVPTFSQRSLEPHS
jgi:hypothetical protein